MVGAFDYLYPIHFQKLFLRGVEYNPGYLSVAREFRAATLRLHGFDPEFTALGRREKGRPLRVALISRRLATIPEVCKLDQDREPVCTRSVSNMLEVEEHIKSNSEGQFEVVVVDLAEGSSLDSNIRLFHGFDIIVGSEGAAFTNLLWMPLNAGLVVLHGKKRGKVFHWFTALAQYYGDSVVNVVLAAHDRVRPPRLVAVLRELARRMEEAEGRGPGAAFSHCRTTDHLPQQAGSICTWEGDTCLPSAKSGRTLGSTELCGAGFRFSI